jgi:hypothetical protein
MNDRPGFFRRHATRLVAILVLLVLYGFGRQPTLPPDERFAFARTPLPDPPDTPEALARTIRPVHPDLAGIAGWISTVGAAIGLTDLDADGLANDACHVDTRDDRVVVSPVPGTGDRFALFTLEPAPLPHDRATMAPMGCLPGDWNEDGRMDLLVYYWGRPPIAFLRRAGDGAPAASAFRPVPVAPVGERWYTNALTSADVDGDGHLDLIVGNYFPDGARILDARGGGREHMHRSMSRSENGGKNRLLLWQAGDAGDIGADPSVRFVDVPDAFDPQTTFSWTLAAGAADLDGDLLPEIYFGNDFGNDRLLSNRSTPGHPRFVPIEGRRTFLTPASKVLGHDSFKGMGTDFVDLNGDGWLDIYVSNIAQNWALEESHFVWVSTGDAAALRRGVAPYRDMSEPLGLARSGWGWDARFADFDDDGVPEATQAIGFLRGERNRWPELHELAMGNDNNMYRPASWPHFLPGDDLSGHLHNPFFVRAASGRYFDLAEDVPGLGDPQVSRGISLADVDGDGDLDFAVANQWETSYFFRNDSPRRNASLELDLRLPAPEGRSRPAVGAAVTVHLPDGRRLVAQVDGGTGHSGKRAPELHFGLGRLAASTPLAVEAAWRDETGTVRRQTIRLTPGRHSVLLGGSRTPAVLAAQGGPAIHNSTEKAG